MSQPLGRTLDGARLAVAIALLAACSGDAPTSGPTPGEPPTGVDAARVAWLAEHAHPLTSVSPDDRDFSDLEPLREAIGDARIVMLGEQSHGDGTTLLAKARLIQFLHEEMGFDVLAWESGIHHLYWANRHDMQTWPGLLSAQRTAVSAIWSESEQVQVTLGYVVSRRPTSRPLEVAGFDPLPSGNLTSGTLMNDLEELAWKIGFPRLTTMPFSTFLRLAERHSRFEEDEATSTTVERAAYRTMLDEFREAVQAYALAHPADRDMRMWTRILTSMDVQATLAWMPRSTPAQRRERLRLHDSTMAANLVFLADEHYAGRKIIVWATSYHMMRDPATLHLPGSPEPLYADHGVMGEHVADHFGDEAYALGFTAYEGEHGPVFYTPTTLPPAAAGTFESLMHHAGFENAFLDFRRIPAGGEWLRAPLQMRPLDHVHIEGDWTRAFDGIVYTRLMQRSDLRTP